MPAPLRILDRYELIRHLASGGMGNLYLARQVGRGGFERLVVIKSLLARMLARGDGLSLFLNEARAVARLNHPNVVAVHEVAEDRGVYFIAMELIEGCDVRHLMQSLRQAGQRMPVPFAVSIVRDAALGLAHAHSASTGIVHRDVSPANIMVRLDGVTKVVDFGIAAVPDHLDPSRRGERLGKVRYASPEQLSDDPVGPASDQFSLGIVLWEMLTGQRMFAEKSASDVLRRILERDVPAPRAFAPSLPEPLEQVCLRMLEPDPDARWPSCRDAARQLTRLLQARGGASEEATGRFVEVIAGRDVAQRTADLTPERIEIEGMLDSASAVCGACGYENDLRNLFCGACGARLGGVPPAPPAASPPAPPPSAPPPARDDLLADVFDVAQALEGEVRPAVILAFRCAAQPGEEEAARGALAAFVDARRIEVLRHRALEGQWMFDSARRALEAAQALTGALQAVARGVSIGLAAGDLEVHRAGGRVHIEGAVVEAADELARLGVHTEAHGAWIHLAASVRAPGAQLEAVRLTKLGANPRVVSARRFCGWSHDPQPELTGRAELLLQVQELLSRAETHRGGAALFVGPPGAGRTRLLEAAAELAAEREVAPCVFELGSRSADDAVQSLLASLGDTLDLPGATLDVEARLAALRVDSAVIDAARGLARGDVGADGYAAERRRSAVLSILRAASRARPLLILVDDAHRADPEGLRILEGLGALSDSAAIAVLVTSDEFDGPDLGESYHRAALPALSDPHMVELIRRRLGGDVDEALARRLLSLARGVPGTAVLGIEALVEAGDIVPREGRWSLSSEASGASLPSDPDQLLRARLGRLAPETRDLLRVGSLLGPRFSSRTAWAALGKASSLEAVRASAIASGLVRATPNDEDTLVFTRAKTQAGLRRRLRAQDRRTLHARIARVLAASPDVGEVACALHFLEAGTDDEASAQALLRCAMALRPGAQSRSVLSAGEAVLTRWLERGRVFDALVARDLNRLARAATACLSTQDLGSADRIAVLVEAHVPAGLDPRGRLLTWVERARVALLRSEIGPAIEALDQADDLAAGPDEQAAFWPRALLRAEALEQAGHLDEAAQRLEAAVRARGTEDPAVACAVRNHLGRISFRAGQGDRARALFEQTIADGDAHGLPLWSARARINLGAALARAGDLASAEANLQAALEAAERAGDRIEAARAGHNLGEVRLLRRDPASARGAFELALRYAREVGWTEGEVASARARERC